MLQQIPSRVPKGNQRNKLKEDGRIIELAFNRGMTSKETTRLIINAFREISGAQKIQFLQANRDNTMEVHTQQDLDGNGVLSLAGSGSLYVQQMEESDDQQMEESGDDLPDIKFGQQPSSSLTTSCETSTPAVPPETSTPAVCPTSAVPRQTLTPTVPRQTLTPTVPRQTLTPTVPRQTLTPAVPRQTLTPAVPRQTTDLHAYPSPYASSQAPSSSITSRMQLFERADELIKELRAPPSPETQEVIISSDESDACMVR
jgi:hypothetical protein